MVLEPESEQAQPSSQFATQIQQRAWLRSQQISPDQHHVQKAAKKEEPWAKANPPQSPLGRPRPGYSSASQNDHRSSPRQKYEIQLRQLEEANRRRLMMARQEQDMTRKQDPEQVQDVEPDRKAPGAGGTPAQDGTPTHYTISEDEVGMGQLKNLIAIKSNPNQPAEQQARAQQQQQQQLRMQQLQAEQQLNQSIFTGRVPTPILSNPAFTRGMTGGDFAATASVPSAPLSESDLLQSMWQYIETLEAQLGITEAILDPIGPSPINIQVFHCLGDRRDGDSVHIYLAEPEWDVRDKEVMLRGCFPVQDPDGYIEKKGDITFVVYKYYNLKHQKPEVEEAMKAKEPLPSPEPAYQNVRLISDEMNEAMEAFVAQHPDLHTEFPELHEVEEDGNIRPPYIWWYHYRKSHKIQNLPPRQAELVTALTDWIESNHGTLYDKIDHQFRTGRVSKESMEYLIRPGHLLILNDDTVLPSGYVATTRPELSTSEERSPHGRGKPKYQWSWNIRVRSYIYAGEFFRKNEIITLTFETETENGEVDIANLKVVLFHYANDHVKEVLERRGKTFWKCRSRRLVSYEGSLKSKDKKHAGQRFMTDFSTYKELHPSNTYLQLLNLNDLRDSVNVTPHTNLPTDDSEPPVPEIYLFPTHIPGFDLHRKKWVDLEVDRIRDVTWNDQAFQSLVADEDMKQLILALVTNQLASETATDLIDNKGNGLIMLLHGSPGTGKTFTAESVAEIAKKPLYPVTCGDIGTEPEAVEKYLTSVFHLGKIWDCVVLLDEAEVFLEQRTLQDLKRNALVSVFLRALEYYDGILILTTNRVGTFDEAFKSRIQLALRYEKLRNDQRKQIWRNFLNRLRDLGEETNIDFNDVVLHLDELALYPMNGREIRNSITTARQLAKFMKEKMKYSHLKRAIGVAEKFDRYLAEVREGDVNGTGGRGTDGRYSDDYFARVDQVR
ncbi:hypothetical protein C7999DRAFT_11704 [Corynascus novoguineensis]|uniref:AAA+ ATPase domain-containing protein n=1 Tax=Corynascus novoguineensis TaxID=1126955 RepID=A0AAN7HME0_9PEZI|nr:hypothetical protein C7999DRAFT_11704 [Corynascus novoguineensis]